MNKERIIIFLDFSILILGILWGFYSLMKGINWLEVFYIYYFLVTAALVLNLLLLLEKNKSSKINI